MSIQFFIKNISKCYTLRHRIIWKKNITQTNNKQKNKHNKTLKPNFSFFIFVSWSIQSCIVCAFESRIALARGSGDVIKRWVEQERQRERAAAEFLQGLRERRREDNEKQDKQDFPSPWSACVHTGARGYRGRLRQHPFSPRSARS